MNASELLLAYSACQDLPQRQAFLFQHCQDMLQVIKEMREALIKERAQVIAISEYYHHDWHDRFYTDGENLEDDAEKELQKEGIL